jgi:hypothetical protein
VALVHSLKHLKAQSQQISSIIDSKKEKLLSGSAQKPPLVPKPKVHQMAMGKIA